jgi:transposase InsO family protein
LLKYFTKWAEAESFTKIEAAHLIRFIMRNIFARFGVPKAFVSDNGPKFKSTQMATFCKRFRVEHHFSSPPQGNGQAEATNKTLIRIVSKTVESRTRGDWPDRLLEALWAYRTSIRTATGQTPFSLVVGMDAILPIELKIPSLRVLLDDDMTDNQKIKNLSQLYLLDGRKGYERQSTHKSINVNSAALMKKKS